MTWQYVETAPFAMHFLAAYFDHDCGDWCYGVIMRDEALEGQWKYWRELPDPPKTS